MSHPRLYLVPREGYEASLDPLTISGSFGLYVTGEEFDGSVQINGSVGKCTVRVVESSLPGDALVYVDNFNKQVILRWAAYEPPGTVTSVPGGSFSSPDDGRLWDLGEKWFVGPGDYSPFGVVMNWGIMLGTDYATSKPVPCLPGASITLVAEMEQGASSRNACYGNAFLRYLDSSYNELSTTHGNVVSDGSGGARENSTVTAVAPAGTAFVSAGLRATRTREAKRLYVHSMSWNHSYGTGTNADVDFSITLEVTDSAGRTATYTETLSEEVASLWTPALANISPYAWLNDSSDLLDAGGGLVSELENLGESAVNPFKQTDNTKRPLAVTGLAGRRVVRLDGVDNFLDGSHSPTYAGARFGYIFVVWEPSGSITSGTSKVLSNHGTSVGANSLVQVTIDSAANPNKLVLNARRVIGDSLAQLVSTSNVSSGPQMALLYFNFGTREGRLYVNGSLEAQSLTFLATEGSTGAGGFSNVLPTIGCSLAGTAFAPIDLAEFFTGRSLSAGVALSDADIDRMFGYAAYRWELQHLLPALHPYKTNPPVIED